MEELIKILEDIGYKKLKEYPTYEIGPIDWSGLQEVREKRKELEEKRKEK